MTDRMIQGAIFCDGSCRGNGTARAVAGWAWAYWAGPIAGEPTTSAARPLPPPATNQRAELTALLEAMRWANDKGVRDIYTDSMYAINCTSKWGPSWKRAGWKRGSGEPLQNLDIIQSLVEVYSGGRWRLHHVRGHQSGSAPTVVGNNWVDRAAVEAACGQIRVPAMAVAIPPSPVAVAPQPPAPPPKSNSPAGFRSGSDNGNGKKIVGQTDIRKWFGGS